MRVEDLLSRRANALDAAYSILDKHEESQSRVIELRESLRRLSGLPVDVAAYYSEAIKALSVGCYRAAIVMAWAGFIYMVAERIVSRYQPQLITSYPKWKVGTTEELLESVPEAQILEAGKRVGVFKKQSLQMYLGWLSTRNQSAHPTFFEPSRNVAIGFVDAVVGEVAKYT